MARPRFFPRPAHLERRVVRGPSPVAAFEVASVDVMYGRGMAGRAGHIRIGEPSSPSRKYAGELGPHQFFKGAAPLARAAADRKGFNQALPSTHGPVAQQGSNAVVDLLSRVPL